MASIANDPGGRRRILFVAPDESRKTIRLGKCDRKTAEAIARHVEALLAAKIGGQPVPRDTAVWLATIAGALRSRLARVGLVENRPRVSTFAELADDYQARPDIKASTKAIRAAWTRTLAHILGDVPVDRVTPQDADRLRDALAAELAPPTVGRMLRYARQVLELGVQRGELARNPLASLRHNFKEGTGAPRDYITTEETDRLLDACPPAWRALIGLARYGGLRCPSEGLLVRWADVDLPGRRLVVRSPKTEAQGKGWRVVPITPKLYRILEEAEQLAPEGSEFVVDLPQYRSGSANWVGVNIRTQLGRIMRRAGLRDLARPFRVFRSSCVSDWAQKHPVHATAAWAGHTIPIAGRHYLTVRDVDF